MALAYNADGDYVIAGYNTGDLYMDRIRELPHCLSGDITNGIYLHWVDFDADECYIYSYSTLTSRISRAKAWADISKMFVEESRICCIGPKFAMVYERSSLTEKYKIPPLEFELDDCTFLRFHEDPDYYEMIADGRCYRLHFRERRTEILKEMIVTYLGYDCYALTIYWSNTRVWSDPPCLGMLQFGDVTIFPGEEIFVAVHNATGAYVCMEPPPKPIVWAEMNIRSILVHTSEATYVGSIGNTKLIEFIGTLERSIQPTKSARTN